MRKGLKGKNPDQEPQRRRWGGGERDADRRSHPRGNQSPPQFRDAEAAAQRFRLLGGKAAGWARGSAVLGHCCPGPILNCSRERKVRCQRSIRYWILRRWPRRMPRDPYSTGKQQGGPAVAGRSGVVPRLSRGVSGNQHLRHAETSYNLPAVHQCAERSPGDHQRSFLERQRDRCRFDLGGDARRDGLAVDAVWRRGELRYS